MVIDMSYEVCNTVIKVNLELQENQELNLRSCHKLLKEIEVTPKQSSGGFSVSWLRFVFQKYFFNVFHTGKIQVFTSNSFNEKDFERVLKELRQKVFDKSIVSF